MIMEALFSALPPRIGGPLAPPPGNAEIELLEIVLDLGRTS